MHRRQHTVLILFFAATFAAAAVLPGETFWQNRKRLNKDTPADDGLQPASKVSGLLTPSNKLDFLAALPAHERGTPSSGSGGRQGRLYPAAAAVAALVGWCGLSVAWLLLDARRRRALDPFTYDRLEVKYAMRAGAAGEVPVRSDDHDANNNDEKTALLRGRVVWASGREVAACLLRSLVHEGWRSVRTVDEVASALVVQVLIHAGV